VRLPIVIGAIVAAASALATLETPASAAQTKPALVFELDEGWGDGIIQNQDMVALKRILAQVKAFNSRFETYALLPAAAADRSKLANVLNELKAEGVPFLLEAESSDTIQLNANAANAPYDAAHGFGSSVAQLEALRKTYGPLFAGIRFMEVFGMNQQIVGCKQFGASWCHKFSHVMPDDNFFQKDLIEPYIAFAHRNHMMALFGDHYWSANYDPKRETYDGKPYFSKEARVTPEIFDKVMKQPQNERDVQALAAKYPGVLAAVYDNNDAAGGVDNSAGKIDTWATHIMRPFIATGGFKGFGLSDQSWLCPERPRDNHGTECPVAGVIAWARNALAQGAIVIETEPAWYWFNLPPGEIAPRDYTREPRWADRGYATANLKALAAAFGVELPQQP
jgi:hypothetical protein